MKHGKAVATNGVAIVPIQVFHWWPGREFLGSNPIPAYFVDEAKRRNSRYLTFAVADVPQGPISGLALCCPKDTPDRAMGRRIALGRLDANLESLGLGWMVQ